jgi:hypothetical protein
MVEPGTAGWDDVVPALANRRLNAADGVDLPARWARESVLYRFTPAG